MRELLNTIDNWSSEGHAVALATVVRAWGSAPRPLGSTMAISSTGAIAGSVSGGCVEGAVAEEARLVLTSGTPRLVTYGVANETAWSVGLSCGGKIDVFIEKITLGGARGALFDRLSERLRADDTTVRAVAVDGPMRGNQMLLAEERIVAGTLGLPDLDSRALDHYQKQSDGLSSSRVSLEAEGEEHDIFFNLHLPRPTVVIIGAVHVAIHLVAFARRLGYATIVIDPRTAFATPERFAQADRLVTEWPQEALAELPVHETTCFVFLSHDLKIDVPGLEIALRSPALYVGALGSTRTHAKRVEVLRERGIPDDAIARISAPIGLDLGGRRAEEIALAIIAEIVAARYGREPRS